MSEISTRTLGQPVILIIWWRVFAVRFLFHFLLYFIGRSLLHMGRGGLDFCFFSGDSSPPFLFANAFKAAALISASIGVLVHAGGAEAEVADEVCASVLTSATRVADRLRFRLPPALPLTSSSFGSAFARGRSDLLGFGVHPAGEL